MSSTIDRSVNYGFVRRPKWMISHVLVFALIAAMTVAGLWQLQRHSDRQQRNDLISARSNQAPVPLGSIVAPGDDWVAGDTHQFRQVVVSGQYQVQDEVLVRNRTFEGAPGWWVLTPLVTDQGWAVTVNRGWISIGFDADEPRPGTEPPLGAVEITGWVQPARTAEGFQISDPDQGRLSSLARPDIERLGRQLDYPLAPVVVRLNSDVAEGDRTQPIALKLPNLDSGPHLSYAAQWFIFAAIALVGYPIVLRKMARRRPSSVPDYDDDL